MPITNGGNIYYSMPHRIKKEIDYTFCETLLKELHNVYGFSLNGFNWETIGYCEGTGGWFEAFASTCRLLNKGDVLLYYNSLDWYDSDLFDSEVSDMLSAFKLVLPNMKTEEIARQLEIKEDAIGTCQICNGDYHKDEMVMEKAEDECEDDKYYCKDCYGKSDDYISLDEKEDIKAHRIDCDIVVAIKEVLGLEDGDFFKCEKCGEYHFNFNKGKTYCNHCEINEISENPRANNHYKNSIELNKKFMETLK